MYSCKINCKHYFNLGLPSFTINNFSRNTSFQEFFGKMWNRTNSGWPKVLEFLELFWNFFGTGNVLEKSHFFRLVLELLKKEYKKSHHAVIMGNTRHTLYPSRNNIYTPFKESKEDENRTIISE